MAGDSGGHHAVKHVNPTRDHFEDLRWSAKAHGVARFILRQKGDGVFDGAKHFVFGFTYGNAADCVAVEVEFDEFASRLLAEVGVDRALDDAEMVLSARPRFGFVGGDPFLAALGPSTREGEGFSGVCLIARVGWALVEKHGNVGAEGGLNFHAELRSEEHLRTIEVILEADAFLGDFPKFRERPDLESARVSEHGFLPSGEIMESAEVADQFVAWAEPEVVGIPENDLRTEFLDFLGVESFDGALSADGHENRCFDGSMRQNESSAARGGLWIGGEDGE
ncbi:MAG: hypothetical protein RLZZ245_3897 [Verrucomicrobiota bacterium]